MRKKKKILLLRLTSRMSFSLNPRCVFSTCRGLKDGVIKWVSFWFYFLPLRSSFTVCRPSFYRLVAVAIYDLNTQKQYIKLANSDQPKKSVSFEIMKRLCQIVCSNGLQSLGRLRISSEFSPRTNVTPLAKGVIKILMSSPFSIFLHILSTSAGGERET